MASNDDHGGICFPVTLSPVRLPSADAMVHPRAVIRRPALNGAALQALITLFQPVEAVLLPNPSPMLHPGGRLPSPLAITAVQAAAFASPGMCPMIVKLPVHWRPF